MAADLPTTFPASPFFFPEHFPQTLTGRAGPRLSDHLRTDRAAAGALAPLTGGIFADFFFATCELSLTINWSEPLSHVSWYALNLRVLDFLFLLAFIIGFISINLIGRVREEGAVTCREPQP